MQKEATKEHPYLVRLNPAQRSVIAVEAQKIRAETGAKVGIATVLRSYALKYIRERDGELGASLVS